jgi:peptidoglycan/LPS O-acetylase OafA/YrhL
MSQAAYLEKSATPDSLSGTGQLPARGDRFYKPQLDVLRLFAFLLVFMLHAAAIEPQGRFAAHPLLIESMNGFHWIGACGLPLFFFLSSYLITTLLLLERARTGVIALRSFYIRRILRIWPLYLSFLLFVFALGHIWQPVFFGWKPLAAYLLLSGNWYIVAGGTVTPAVITLWSISLEEQFYLLWPRAVRALTVDKLKLLSIALCAISLLTAGLLATRGPNLHWVWCNSLPQALFFASGSLLAIRNNGRSLQPSILKGFASIALALLLWQPAVLLAFIHGEQRLSPFSIVGSYVLIALGCVLALQGFLQLPPTLMPRPLVYLGRISYGLYVFHTFILLICSQVLAVHFHIRGGLWAVPALPLIVLMAALSYQFLEKPFLKLKNRFEVVHSRTA